MKKNKIILEEKLIREFIEILLEEKSKSYEFLNSEMKCVIQSSLVIIGCILLLNPAGLVTTTSLATVEVVLASVNIILNLTNLKYNEVKDKYEYSPELFDALINIGGIGLIKYLSILKNKSILDNINFQTKDKVKLYNVITNLISAALISFDVAGLPKIIKRMYEDVTDNYPDLKDNQELRGIFTEFSEAINTASNTKELTQQELENVVYFQKDMSNMINSLNIQEKVNEKSADVAKIIQKKLVKKDNSKNNSNDSSWDFSWFKNIFKPMKYKMNNNRRR
jgi:hypothetical protein